MPAASIEPAYGQTLSRYLGSGVTPGAMVRSPADNPLSVDRVRTSGGTPCVSTPLPSQDAFHIVLQLQNMASHDLWLDGRLIRTDPYARGSVSIIDLRRSSRTRIATAHDALVFYMDRRGLNEIAAEFGTPPVTTLRLASGTSVIDPVLARLGAGLLPQIGNPNSDRMLHDELLLVMQAHVATVYGGQSALAEMSIGGLAPWQERRAKDALDGAVGRKVTLAEVAREVSLSPTHFARSFQRSTGFTPSAWLANRRMSVAQTMLLAGQSSIAAIAQAVGYAEQSSFTRAFQRHHGLSPGVWMRLNRYSSSQDPE